MDHDALKAELLAGHPTTGAYDADSLVAANQINAINRPYILPTMSGKQLMDETDTAEYDALTDVKKSQWLSYTSHGEVDTTVNGMGQTIGIDIFGAGSNTAVNIGAARSVNISRAQELDFPEITPGDIEYARSI